MTDCPVPRLVPSPASVLPEGWKADFRDLNELNLVPVLLELIRKASTELPGDVVRALMVRREQEEPGSRARNTMGTMLENVAVGAADQAPLCQDTGTLIFWVRHPFGHRQRRLKAQIREAVVEATQRNWLRPNCVAALSGRNTNDNLDPFGEGHPIIHFEEWDKVDLEVDVMLKGGGCENTGAQYRLPDPVLGAGRDLAGVRRCIIDAVVKAQGYGCSPGTLGVTIGGDRVSGYERSKELLMRKVGSPNPDPSLDAFEKELERDLNTLGIGPMGYGGKTTVLGVFVEEMYRHPASFFVSLSYMCWNNRRMTLRLDPTGTPSFQ